MSDHPTEAECGRDFVRLLRAAKLDVRDAAPFGAGWNA
jgi:hypothetical protein